MGRIRDIVEGNVASKQERKVMEVEVTKDVDFLDQEFHKVKIEIEKEQLKIFLTHISNAEPILQIPMKLSDYLNLDNGSAYLGFMHET